MSAFPDIQTIPYEGPSSKNPLAFKHYNPDELVDGKTMREHLRFSVVYWHTFRGTGSDPFGAGTMLRPWDDGSNSINNAQKRARVAFEFIEKLGAPFYAFHDRDVAPEGASLAESNKNLDAVVKVLKDNKVDVMVSYLPKPHRHQAPLGHSVSVCESAIPPRRGDKPERRRLHLRRRASEEGARSHA